ncbi:MAG TPA: polysaccharide deacetylase family protein [Gemmatimonadaceae bacterium]|nr:polysaccharide deacetylase family protein [Gemmatimonadaceae bacterium]
MIFWDYDTQWGGDRSRSPGGPKTWGHDEFVNTERLLALHAEYGVPACFAVVGAAALDGPRPYHDPAQIRAVHHAGHEVASHSFKHEWLPGLGIEGLRATLRQSKDALEQCIGAPVVSFVPPFNQPIDYPAALSISVSERRSVPRERIGVRRLCEELRDAGYRVCRLAYRSLAHRLAERGIGRRIDRPLSPRRIAGVMCVRLNTPGGFTAPNLEVVERCADQGGVVAVYGHPHSLAGSDPQSERSLVPFLERVSALRREGRVKVGLPRDLVRAVGVTA